MSGWEKAFDAMTKRKYALMNIGTKYELKDILGSNASVYSPSVTISSKLPSSITMDCSGMCCATTKNGEPDPETKGKIKRPKYKTVDENDLINLEIKDVIFNDPATIIFWGDGTKTIVKCTKGQKFNKYFGFCAAVTKHIFETNSLVNRIVDKARDEKPVKEPEKKKKGKKNG